MIQERNSSVRLARKAFTLIELLVVIAILAILTAILFPVFAQAKQAAKTSSTSSSLRQIGMASIMYLDDYDEVIVLPSHGRNDQTNIWPVTLRPYTKSRTIYFDPSRQTYDQDLIEAKGFKLPWFQVPTLAINNGGYTGHQTTTTGGCSGKVIESNFIYGGRSMATMNEPERRVAFAPNTWGGTRVGWNYFQAHQASRPAAKPNPTDYDVYNQVYDVRPVYSGGTIPVVHADGSAGKLRPKDFKVAPSSTADYCAWMEAEGMRTWGPFWNEG